MLRVKILSGGLLAGLLLAGVAAGPSLAQGQYGRPGGGSGGGHPGGGYPYGAQNGQMKLIRDPVYGELRDVLGAALPVAVPNPKCSKPAQLPDGACLDAVAAGMKARGATDARVLTAPGAEGGAGYTVTGPIGQAYRLYDVSLAGGMVRWAPVTLPSSSVQAPKGCYSTGRGVDYRLDMRGGALTAQELQTVSCGGPIPPVGAAGPRRMPIAQNEPGERWPATATVEVLGTSRQLAAPRPDCPPEAVLRDGVCFASGIAVLAAAPGQKELDVIGAKRAASPGEILAAKQTEQYVLKRKGKTGFKADKRWFDKSLLTAPAGCGLTTPVDFEIEPGERVRERALADCGAPPAPQPTALYEAYGATLPVVMGNRPGCAQQGLQLLGNACFTDVIAYMRAWKIAKAEVLVLERPYPVGTRVPGGGPVAFSYADVWANADGTNRADRKYSASPRINAGGCATVTDAGPHASGVVLIYGDGGIMAQAYQLVACPVR